MRQSEFDGSGLLPVDACRFQMHVAHLRPQRLRREHLDASPVLEDLQQQLAVVPIGKVEREAPGGIEDAALVRMPDLGGDPAVAAVVDESLRRDVPLRRLIGAARVVADVDAQRSWSIR